MSALDSCTYHVTPNNFIHILCYLHSQPGPAGAAASISTAPAVAAGVPSQPAASVPMGRGALLAGLLPGRGKAASAAPPAAQSGIVKLCNV